MPNIGYEAVTYMDLVRMLDPDGKIAKIVEILNEENSILQDLKMMKCNKITSHLTTVRTYLPEGTYRGYNQGVKPKKAGTEQHTFTCALLEARSAVDKELADLNGNTNEFRFSEDRAYIEGLTQQQAQCMIYGNEKVNPKQFTGLTPLFNSFSESVIGHNAKQIINAGGKTELKQTSIWFVDFSENGVHGIYPDGLDIGIQHKDLGETDLIDEEGGKYRGYESLFQWRLGLAIRDPRHVARICNIDTTTLSPTPTPGESLLDYMIDAFEVMSATAQAKCKGYCNRKIYSWLTKQAIHKSNAALGWEDIQGKRVLTFWGIPLKRVDKILLTEAVVQ